MKYRVIVLIALCIFLSATVSADEIRDEDVTLEMPQEFDRGEEITAEMVIEGHNHSHSDLTYSFRFGAEEIETDEPKIDYEVLSDFERARACAAPEGSTDACDDARGLENNEPDDFVDISVEPQPVERGETLEAEVSVDGDFEGNLMYRWNERDVSREVPDDQQSGLNEISVDTLEGDPRGESYLEVDAIHEERGIVGTDREQVQWDIYTPDVEEYDVDYGDEEVQITIADDYSEGIRSLRFGESLDGWSQADIMKRRVRAGGVDLNIEETSDHDAPGNLEVYSVIELSGKNIEGLDFRPRAEVSKDWLENRDLLIGERNAKLNFYKVHDGEWVKLKSRVFQHDREGEIVLDNRAHESEEENYVLEEDTKMAIAGDPEGELDRTFAVNSEGDCDRFEDNEPVPPGWNEIETTCSLHRQSQQVKEDINRFEEQVREQANRSNTFALPDNFERNLSEIREKASNYEIEEARKELEQYREEVGNERRVSRRSENVEERFVHIREEFASIPEEHLNAYNQSEEALELRDEIEQHIEDNETAKAYQKMQTLEEEHLEAIERISQRERLKDKIERLRNTQDLKENHTELLEEAEQDLENGDIRVAQEKVNRVGQEFQREMFRQMIRRVVMDILRDVLPFEIGGSGQSDSTR